VEFSVNVTSNVSPTFICLLEPLSTLDDTSDSDDGDDSVDGDDSDDGDDTDDGNPWYLSQPIKSIMKEKTRILKKIFR
jgi:hypothetical protein